MEKSTYDRNQPQGSMSLMNLRNTLRSLHQGDLMSLRPRASMILDDFEYPSKASAEEVWTPTACGVSGTSVVHEGNYSINISGTALSGTIAKTESQDLDTFLEMKLWHQGTTGATQALQAYLKDSSGNISYWAMTTDGTVDTWAQETLDLTTADGNNGTDAELDDIVEYGFKTDASKNYKIDLLETICGLNVAVEGTDLGDYYKQVYVSNQPLDIIKKSSPLVTPPAANSRIDILYVDENGDFNWITGAEAITPVPLWASVSSEMLLICLIYCRVGMVQIVDYEDKGANPTEGYIYSDIRPRIRNRYTLPSGMIMMWSGLISAIPSGFVICDGNNSTPNLLDKFIKSVATAITNPGTTGGSYSLTIAEAELPIHNHTLTSDGAHVHTGSAVSNGAHTHTGSAASGGSHGHSASASSVGNHTHGYDRLSGGGDVDSGAAYSYTGTSTGSAGAHGHTITVGSGGSHTHTISATSGGAHTHTLSIATNIDHTHTVGNTGSGDAITLPKPEFYSLAFIMKS